jgi:hypothetical protein
MHAQNAPTKQDNKPAPQDPYESYIVPSRETRIDDGAIRRRPEFVIADDEGWKQVGWEW